MLNVVAHLILIAGTLAAVAVFITTGFEFYGSSGLLREFHPEAFVYAFVALLPSLFAWALLLGLADIIALLRDRPEQHQPSGDQ